MTQARYFQTYNVEEDGPLEAHPRPADPGGPLLPFDYLGPRTLEILAYRLLSAERTGADVVLMQGVGERGRDLLVLRGGSLEAIVQCKNYRDRLNARQVREEPVKVALHAYLEPSILPAKTAYELWVPGGLSEDAERLFATWPNEWDEERLRPDVTRVIERYAAFSQVHWDSARTFLLDEFSGRITPVRINGVDLALNQAQPGSLFREFS